MWEEIARKEVYGEGDGCVLCVCVKGFSVGRAYCRGGGVPGRNGVFIDF